MNGTVAGGGYELALACDEILMIDDRSSTVSLPEVPLLGVLPGTGGLTRLTDKRKVRRDLADVFCTTSEGVRADRAKQWKLVDHIAKPQQFADAVKERGRGAGRAKQPPRHGHGHCPAAARRERSTRRAITIAMSMSRSTATRARRPSPCRPRTTSSRRTSRIHARGAQWWPLAMARELDDAILMLRTNDLEIGTWILKTRGAVDAVLARDAMLTQHARRLVRTRNHRLAAPDAGAPGCVVAHVVRHRRPGLVLRRHACSNWRSPPIAVTCCSSRRKKAVRPRSCCRK